MRRKIFTITVLLLSYCTTYSQISTNEEPISFITNIPTLRGENTLKTLPSLDMEKIKQEDKEDEANGIPPRFGYQHKVNFDLENSGEWVVLPDGDKIWRLIISCPDALSINLLYDKFWLPDGAKFFIYSNDQKHYIGAFTSVNNKGNRNEIQGFATGLVYSDQITLEYYLPKDIRETGVISIAYVVQGYKYILVPNKLYGQSGNCNININCTQGQNWQDEKNAVALILVNGNRYCSGSLVNTTANDRRPLFLTADHCLGGWGNSVKHDAITAPNLNHWSFYWHYESPNCTSTFDPPFISTSGATVVANNQDSDFALLQLTENPRNKNGVTPYYLGWDNSGNAGTDGVGIHHPSGDIKKICLTNQIQNQSTAVNFGSFILAANTSWRTVWNAGTTEGGSSGSSLINENSHIIGQLAGGSAGCNNLTGPDFYGKFSVSWNGNGATDNRRRLSDWLDPNNTNATILNGISCPTIVNFISQPPVTSNLTLVSCGDINIQTVIITGNNVTVTLDARGNINVQDVQVKNGATLILKAGGKVNIIKNFKVDLGSKWKTL